MALWNGSTGSRYHRIVAAMAAKSQIVPFSKRGWIRPAMSSNVGGRIQPRLLNGTIWLFAAIAATILWYRLPVDPFHKAILIGFVPYLLIFTTGLNILDSYGWDLRTSVNYAQVGAYVALMAYWAHAAWSP